MYYRSPDTNLSWRYIRIPLGIRKKAKLTEDMPSWDSPGRYMSSFYF